MFVRRVVVACIVTGVGGVLAACGPAEKQTEQTSMEAEASVREAPGLTLEKGLVLALAQSFAIVDGKPSPGFARLEFLQLRDGEWQMTYLEDGDSNVFHKAMLYERGRGPELLTLGGTAAQVKTWVKRGDVLEDTSQWSADFGGKFSRMRDAEVGDLYGDGEASIAVATHDQGVVAILRPDAGAFEVVQIDERPNTFVHEIEIGDLDGDGVLEVYATPSEPNRLGSVSQKGVVVRYVPQKGEGPVVVADFGDRHAKEILVEDVDGDGLDELYAAVESDASATEEDDRANRVEIRRYDAGTAQDAGFLIATVDDERTRFLTAGDIDGDGKKELVAASNTSGLWLFRPGADPRSAWSKELIDAESAGFEHAAILTDLDGDGVDELYAASERHREVRRYVWRDGKPEREVIYVRADKRRVFTWNLMPVPVDLIPAGPAVFEDLRAPDQE